MGFLNKRRMASDSERTNKSLLQLADKLVASAKDIMRTARSEEDLRVGFEKHLEPILKTVGIKTNPKYEHYGKRPALSAEDLMLFMVMSL